MRKLSFVFLSALVAIALTATVTFAASGSPHFINSATNAGIVGNNLVANFKEAGLSNGSVETITLSGTGTATYQCFNNGGNHPKAGNKETVSADLSASGQFTVQNGNVIGTLSLSPPGPGSFTCPSGQTLVGPTNVSYTNVRLVDQTSGVVASIPSSYP